MLLSCGGDGDERGGDSLDDDDDEDDGDLPDGLGGAWLEDED